ncbi:peptide chain release factor 2 [Actinospica sp. MGRD01-02]|uniref:Peptide chain release factor 2 n=1 Tax=Actinospica acidithermotolerans TaxID=2828514 RepID=A0A941EDW7_9ACTN|nr:peptide chain release factor 2 [Actinospica acidithermotolerans]MBR7827259.1 peptide chain release factor 2 [Actinospica acidithermotolerans]
MSVDLAEDLKNLKSTMASIEAVVDLDALRAEIKRLNEEAAAPDLWDDQAKAQQVTSRLSNLQGELSRVEGLRRRLDDLETLYELGLAEDDADTVNEAADELPGVTKAVSEMEVRTLLNGEYDSREALVTIRSEAGGVDAADFAEMLLRMYLRYCERHGYPTEVYDTSYAEEAGIKSATFQVKAPYAYGTLSVEQGTHRLVRISPFDNQGRRQTSFAGVEVLPVVEQTDHIDIPEDELRVDVYRSSGPGGQGVNTTDSAVRLTHIPTGIVVSCQNERSQLQNKASAMAVLQAKLLDVKRQEEQAKMDALKGDSGGSWGNQMRSYVLHPYQMVKDLRTEFETGNTSAVLDGEIDGFIEAAIRWRRQR